MSSDSTKSIRAKTSTSTWNPTNFSDLPTHIVRHYIPPLTSTSHKGSSGRIGILGGSERYTGAPYYAAMASLKVGSDLAFVFCAKEAAIPIKCYSPELMVSSVYAAEEFTHALEMEGLEGEQLREQLVRNMVKEVTSLFDRMHVLVVGPGLGRCPLVMRATAEIIRQALQCQLALVLDADALFLLTQRPYKDLLGVVDGGADKMVVLTPNAMEFERLKVAIADCSTAGEREQVEESYEGVIVVQKGQYDRVSFMSSLWDAKNDTGSSSPSVMICREEGGLKRSGGLGDILSGSIGTFLAWNQLLRNEHGENPTTIPRDDELWLHVSVEKLLPCWAACCVAKQATKAAFSKKRRAMTAPDVLEEIGSVVDEILAPHFKENALL